MGQRLKPASRLSSLVIRVGGILGVLSALSGLDETHLQLVGHQARTGISEVVCLPEDSTGWAASRGQLLEEGTGEVVDSLVMNAAPVGRG